MGNSDIYILLCTKQITNKNLLYSKGGKKEVAQNI